MIQYLHSRINLIHNIDDEVRAVYIAIVLNLWLIFVTKSKLVAVPDFGELSRAATAKLKIE